MLARFESAGNGADLDAAVGLFGDAAIAATPGRPDRTGMLSNLGASLYRRFQRAADDADLDAAIDAEKQALAATPADRPDRAGILSNLGTFLRVRFERTGNRVDLDAAIDVGRQAVAATPPGHPDLAIHVSNLGGSLLSRFGRTGERADADAAIDATRQVLAVVPAGHSSLVTTLSDLGSFLRARFERTGDGADLDAAIDAGQQAVAATPPGHPVLGMTLSNLGLSRCARFGRTGNGADLDAAIDAGQQAVAVTPPGHRNFAAYLSNLGTFLMRRFERNGDRADLDQAVEAFRQALTATPSDHMDRAALLANLGSSLSRRFEQTREREDIEAAIVTRQQALAATLPGDPSRASYLSSLGVSLAMRFGLAGDGADLDEAIDAGRQAVAVTPAQYPQLAGYLSNLGTSLHRRFELAGDRADLDAAIGCWRDASQVPTGTPAIRLTAARSWGAGAARAGKTHGAAQGYAAAVVLLPTVVWHGLDRATREEQLTQWAGLASDAAACAVLDGRHDLAVELLEQGRLVLWTQALNLRGDLTRLAEKAPDLARRLESIRAFLDTPVPEVTSLVPEPTDGSLSTADRVRQVQSAADLRMRKAREWDDALAHVRGLAGFEHFLTAIPYTELATAVDGPVVIVNTSSYGCNALIVDADSEQSHVVSLPNMTLDAAVDQANGLLEAVAAASDPRWKFPDREKARRTMLDVLEWLWDVLAEPVLTSLGHTSAPQPHDDWPRVWWCPTGPLTLLPIHAAGHHPRLRTSTVKGTDSVLDRVISSYTPTLTALARARQPTGAAPARQLTVGMPSTPGLPPLPAVAAELKVLARHFPPGEANHQLTGSQATRADVLTAMAAHSWVHMACHASQQHTDPAHGGFALWGATLTINDLASQPTRRRDLAFLSACQTATGSVGHLDEAIHLAAAMQVLGYQHVIATLWTIADSPAPFVADTLYTMLTRGGTPDPGGTAQALHRATHSLRQKDPTNPLLWAPYIHLGA